MIDQPPQGKQRPVVAIRIIAAVDPKAVRNQQNRFAPRQLVHSLDDIANRAERADRKDLFTKLIKVFVKLLLSVVLLGGIFNGRKGADGRTPVQLPLHAFDGRVKLSLIGGELLQGANAAARPDDCYQIAGLHLFIHKLLQRAADVVRAYKREAKIVNDQRDGSLDVFRMKFGGRNRRRILIYRRCPRRLRSSWSFRRDKRKVGHLLLLTVFGNLHFIGAQIIYNLSVLVCYYGINLNQIGSDLDNIIVA